MKVFAAVLFATALIIGTASAQGVPDGSYLFTCTDISIRNDTLSASCRTRNGRHRPSFLRNAMACSGGIENIDGRLECTGVEGGYLPRGSYRRSCTDLSLSGGTMYAVCRTGNGAMVRSRLHDFHRYGNTDISNCDGVLRPGGC